LLSFEKLRSGAIRFEDQPRRGVKVQRRPVVGITMGDPTGIGPEITVKALAESDLYAICRPLVIGDAHVMDQAIDVARITAKVNRIGSPSQARYRPGSIDVLDLGNVEGKDLVHGRVDERAGRAAAEYIKRAVDLALSREIEAVVTCPIHKEAINMAGFHYPGHTEFLAHLTGTQDYAMMLVHGDFRIVHCTTHVSLREACELITTERIIQTIKLANLSLKRLGIEEPRIGVAGLNPHAGEGGLFGTEEIEQISPAIEEARKEGILAEGPIPPDTVFAKARSGLYDVVIAMYHDQGHIALKSQEFTWNKGQGCSRIGGVNVTLGLPFARTSVDHGVAFDIAGKGLAVPDSLVEAIRLAVQLTGP